jgi:hypothetical protein
MAEERPPYVAWEMRSVEDRDASIKAGHEVHKEVAFAVITRPGSRDTLDKEALVWLKELKQKAKDGNVPMTWPMAFQQSFDEWLKGETGAVNGTPIKGWTAIGAAAQKTLLAAGIQTVEDLANLPDGDLQNLGTGAIGFKLKARAYLEAATGPGKLAEQMTALQVQMASLVELTKKQASEIDRLRAFEPKPEKAF